MLFFTLSCPTNAASSDHLVSPRLILCFNCHAIQNKNRNQINLWPHLVRTGSFEGRKHIMQWRSSSGGLINCSSWPDGKERLFGTSAIAVALKPTSSPGSSRFLIWRQQERCINATLRDGRVRLNYRIFFNYNEQQFITRMGEPWAPEHLILQNQFQKQFPAPNWLKNSGEVALHMLT